MGKLINKKDKKQIQNWMVDQLCQLVNQPFYSLNKLSFNIEPFTLQAYLKIDSQNPQNKNQDIQISLEQRCSHIEIHSSQNTEENTMSQQKVSFRAQNQLISKNQHNIKQNKIKEIKIRKIKKTSNMTKNRRDQNLTQNSNFGQQNANFYKSQIKIQDTMRDQNNCKAYHKLVKNYLIQSNLEQQILKYQNLYHTKYYFLIALILIKYHLKINFNEVYKKITQDEIMVQENKIQRKLQQISDIQKNLTFTNQNLNSLYNKKQKLVKQIAHIGVVKYQIQKFSVSSCQAFFEGNIQQSLRILYLKNDTVMKKRYYFDDALKYILEIDNKLRQQSHL